MKHFKRLIPLLFTNAILLSSCFDMFVDPFNWNKSSSSSSSKATTSETSSSTSSSKTSSSSSSKTSSSSSSSSKTSSSSSSSSSSTSSSTSPSSSSSTTTSSSSSSSSFTSSSSSSHSSTTSSSTTSASTSSSSSSHTSSTSQHTSTSSSSSSASSTSSSSNPLDNYHVIETFSKRMPAEFEPVEMVKMCYPNNMPLSVYKTISLDNKILLLVNPSSNDSSRILQARNALNNAGANMDNITFLDMPIDSDYTYWVRDFSPFYVFNNYDLSIVDFTYNRSQRTEQNAVPSKLSTYFDMSYSKMNLTHTGGNLMQDGRGTAFSDDLVVEENSNNKNKVISEMASYTGTDNYVITIDPQGDYIAHIDCWGKIVAPDKIIVARMPKNNSRYQYYEQVAEELANTKCIYGYNYKIYRIDEPGGDIVAPYTNSLIANNHVYMPLGENSTYNQKAIEVYQEALPGYEIVGVEGYDFNDSNCFLNTDALHCRTHEVPDKNMLFIDTREVISGEVKKQDYYLVKSNIVSYAKGNVDDVRIYYSINNNPYVSKNMNQYQNTTNFTYVFDNLNVGDVVKYYIEAKDDLNHSSVDPTCGSLDPHEFTVVN